MRDELELLPKMHDGNDVGDGPAPDDRIVEAGAPRPPEWRTLLRGIVVAAVLFIAWNVLDVGPLLLPIHPLLMAVAELAVIALFAWRYLPRRRTPPGDARAARRELARHAVLRLRQVPRSAWGIVAAWVAATLVLDQLVTMVWFHLVPRANDYPEPFPDLLARPLGWLPVALTMVLAAPLIEEVAFRGWLQRPLERRLGPVPAIAIASLLFALAHGRTLLIPYYVVAGAVLGASVSLTRSLWVAMIAHAAHNAWSAASDAIGLTNARMIEWTARPVVFWLAAGGLAGWAFVMVWLGGRLRDATRDATRDAQRPRSATSPGTRLFPTR